MLFKVAQTIVTATCIARYSRCRLIAKRVKKKSNSSKIVIVFATPLWSIHIFQSMPKFGEIILIKLAVAENSRFKNNNRQMANKHFFSFIDISRCFFCFVMQTSLLFRQCLPNCIEPLNSVNKTSDQPKPFTDLQNRQWVIVAKIKKNERTNDSLHPNQIDKNWCQTQHRIDNRVCAFA